MKKVIVVSKANQRIPAPLFSSEDAGQKNSLAASTQKIEDWRQFVA